VLFLTGFWCVRGGCCRLPLSVLSHRGSSFFSPLSRGAGGHPCSFCFTLGVYMFYCWAVWGWGISVILFCF
jgi:hypothetical protein